MTESERQYYNEAANAKYYSDIANASLCPDCFQRPCKCSQNYSQYRVEKDRKYVPDGFYNYLKF
ncbi:hypothetical protein APK26_gp54 [Acinetobacter phage vB_AbaP_APK26]|uniref:Uncharacterized protein n=1 Tax=Acinetobacter phage vB_AbaP_APK26 TaxID=2797420 RepID=A0A7T8F1B8_9CAUD|nr:hypothetical protein APK26_gp54 [Acinetobacter phage vB_AbaP_APK26]